MTKGNQNRDELIQSLQERLRWYMSEASEEEFDADEVEAIGRLLEAMDGDNWEKPDAEAAYERFQAYCRERELEEKAGRYAFAAGTDSAEEFSEELAPEKAAGSLESGRAKRAARETEAGRALATEDISSRTDAVGTETPAGTGKRRKSGKNRVLRRTWAAVAAALCLMFLGVGGVSMALNDGGWFLKLGDRDDGEELWVVPSEGLSVNGYLSNVYYSYEEVDEEYKDLVPFLSLEDYRLVMEKIEIMEMKNRIDFCVRYVEDKEGELVININLFKDENIILHRKMYDDMENLKSGKYRGIEYCSYESYENQKHYYLFQWNNLIFNVMGDVELEKMDDIVCMLIDKII